MLMMLSITHLSFYGDFNGLITFCSLTDNLIRISKYKYNLNRFSELKECATGRLEVI
jgi:hypothetical protein